MTSCIVIISMPHVVKFVSPMILCVLKLLVDQLRACSECEEHYIWGSPEFSASRVRWSPSALGVLCHGKCYLVCADAT